MHVHKKVLNTSEQDGRHPDLFSSYSTSDTDASWWRQIGRELYWVKHLNTQAQQHVNESKRAIGQNSQLLRCSGGRKKKEAALLVSATYLHKMSHKTHTWEAEAEQQRQNVIPINTEEVGSALIASF